MADSVQSRLPGEVEVQPVGPRDHEGFEPNGAVAVQALELRGIDEHALAHVAVERGTPFDLREPAEGDQIVTLDARKIVFGLSVHRAEYRIGVGAAGHVRDSPGVSHDAHGARLTLPTH